MRIIYLALLLQSNNRVCTFCHFRTKEPHSPIIDNSSEGEEEIEMDSSDRKKDSVVDFVHKETG